MPSRSIFACSCKELEAGLVVLNAIVLCSWIADNVLVAGVVCRSSFHNGVGRMIVNHLRMMIFICLAQTDDERVENILMDMMDNVEGGAK